MKAATEVCMGVDPQGRAAHSFGPVSHKSIPDKGIYQQLCHIVEAALSSASLTVLSIKKIYLIGIDVQT